MAQTPSGTEKRFRNMNVEMNALILGGVEVSSRGPVIIADAASYTVLEADSGLVHVLPDLAADCTITLPTPATGLVYEFILGAAIDAAHDWIITTPSGFFIGGLLYVDDAPAADSVASDGNSNDFMRILTPEAGTWVKVWSDGTNWYVTGQVASANAPTFADT
jgi:hypothetical protein